MNDEHCFECGKPAAHWHHVVPRSRGGTKMVPLCHDCHDLVHLRTDDAGSLLRDAYLRAKAQQQVADRLHAPAVEEIEGDELEWEVTASDIRQAEQSDQAPEFYAKLRAKIRARR